MPKKRSSTKSRIIKAAWNLFYKHGYEQTTVDEIISASKTSKGTFYHYFKGKEALLNTLSYLFDEKYEELAGIVDPDLSAYDKLLFFNHELFHMIETSVDVGLLASLYSSQLITKDKRSLLENDRYYFVWLTETISTALKNGEFNATSTADELLKKLQRVIEGKDVEVFHSGDMDYGGIRIFEYIQKHIFPGIKPLQMDVETYEKYEEYAKTISKETMEKLEKVNVPLLEELKEKLLETGKGIEQESFLIEE